MLEVNQFITSNIYDFHLDVHFWNKQVMFYRWRSSNHDSLNTIWDRIDCPIPCRFNQKTNKFVFAVSPFKGNLRKCLSTKFVGEACHQKSPLIWTEYLGNCISHDQRDLKVTYLRNLNFQSDFCGFSTDEEYYL